MQESDLQDLLDKLQSNACPYAFWSLPGSLEWEGIAQKNNSIDEFDIEQSNGFVIKKFDDKQGISFIRSDFHFNRNELNFNLKKGKSSEINRIDDIPKEISKEEYIIQCSSIIDEINNKVAEKVVFSRVKKEKLTGSAAHLFLRLVNTYPDAMVFIYSYENELWVGASPETLLKTNGEHFYTMALAGSKAVGKKTEWTNKEREEQAYVESYIAQKLKKHVIDYSVDGPKTILAGPVEHLCTDFKGVIKTDKLLELINDLHPTPAVCGIPVEVAKEIIKQRESHNRRGYTGFIGPVNGVKKHLFVNLRSAMIINDNLYLFLGGGITKDSIPKEEWKETELKAETLLRVL